MHARVILANPGRGLYAAHISITNRVTVFELLEGPPLRVGDIVRASFTYLGRQPAQNPHGKEILLIQIHRIDISPTDAQECLQEFEECIVQIEEST